MSVKLYLRSESSGNDETNEVATLETSTKPIKPTDPVIQRGRGRPWKYPVTEDYLTLENISAKQPPPMDILIMI
jgi:hypothetical protein